MEKVEDRKEGSASESSSTGRSQSLKSKGRSGEQNDEVASVNGENLGSIDTILPSWAEIAKENRSPMEDNDLAEKLLSEDVKNMGIGTKVGTGELDKKNSMGQESIGPREVINSDEQSQQGHNREIVEEVRTEEDRVSEYEEAILESTKFGSSCIKLNKKEQRFGSLGEIQDKKEIREIEVKRVVTVKVPMKVLSWNIRGMGVKTKTRAIRKVIAENKVDMLVLQETKKKEEEIGEGEVGRIWYNDEFRCLVASSKGKSGGLLTN
ncbi:hypothetical protein V6N11_024402 [Hibiscus sabdariffa]|uniref:Uncharacterized protein n=1 Tax=Hibiscus sabdariffa TaxID=183260 RepID=A0ABR2NFK1_9ROSI